ncbi:MAG: hypothetical protein Q7R76_00725 [Candidatus Woesearchaeota archaeon]|nr:hypothetical protein [Candidatus Woesearchaeota archaeon]
MNNRRFHDQKKAGGYVTIKRVLTTVGAAGCVYIGTWLSSPTLNESLERVTAAATESGEASAAVGYRVMDTALQSSKQDVIKVLGDVHAKAPEAFQRFVNLAYAVNALNGSTPGQLDPTRLGNVVLGEASIGQRDGTISVEYQQPGSAPQSYAVRTFNGDNGLELVLQRTGLAPISVGPPALTVPNAPMSPGVVYQQPQQPAPLSSAPAPYHAAAGSGATYAPAPSVSAAPIPSIGSLFKTVTH